jgi:hypothetical protein
LIETGLKGEIILEQMQFLSDGSLRKLLVNFIPKMDAKHLHMFYDCMKEFLPTGNATKTLM